MDSVELALKEVLKNNNGKLSAMLLALTLYEMYSLGKKAVDLVKGIKF